MMGETRNIGILLAQRICNDMTGEGIPYAELEKLVYGILSEVERELLVGDWLQFPNGSQFELTFKPKKQE